MKGDRRWVQEIEGTVGRIYEGGDGVWRDWRRREVERDKTVDIRRDETKNKSRNRNPFDTTTVVQGDKATHNERNSEM